jgi:hypothetical protein
VDESIIYIAGKYSSQERLRAVRTQLQEMGYTVLSSWLDETATESFGGSSMPAQSDATDAKMLENAKRDLEEVRQCNVICLDTLDISDTGGREVELGFSLYPLLDYPVVGPDGREAYPSATTFNLIGPKRNIFHHLVHFHYANWDEALAAAAEAAHEYPEPVMYG